MITGDTVTNRQIRALRAALMNAGHADTAYLDDCYMALAIVGDATWWRADEPRGEVSTDKWLEARARCAAIIAARINAHCGRLDCPGGALHAHDLDLEGPDPVCPNGELP